MTDCELGPAVFWNNRSGPACRSFITLRYAKDSHEGAAFAKHCSA
jgi:hypothetical protein